MSKEKTLVKNTIIVTIGKICTQFVSFFLLPLYTALLTTEEYGIVDLLNTLINLLIPIFILRVDQGVFRYLIDKRDNEKEQKRIITTIMYFTFAQIILYSGIFIIVSNWVSNQYKYFLATNLIANTVSMVLLQICRGIGDNTKYTIGSFLSGAFAVILNVVFIAGFRFGAYGMLSASLIANIITIIYLTYSLKIFKYIKKEYYDKSILKDILKYSIPLIPNAISWWIVNSSDRIIITSFINVATNGIYSAANKFSGVVTTMYNVFNLTWTESASVNIEAEDRDSFFNKTLDFTIRLFGSLCIGIIAFMPFIFPIMINNKFADAYWQIPILMLGTIFNILVSFLGSIYVAKKLSKEIAKTSIFAAIINIVINIALIKFIGLYAASISTAVAYGLMLVYRYFDVKKYVNLRIDAKMVSIMVLLYICSFITYYIDNFYLNVIMAIIVLCAAVVINKKTLKMMPKLVKEFVHHSKD